MVLSNVWVGLSFVLFELASEISVTGPGDEDAAGASDFILARDSRLSFTCVVTS